jgi:hypothetical protein
VTLCPVTFCAFTQINTIACMVLYIFVYWLLLTRGTELPPPFWVLIYFQSNFFIISSLFPEFILDNKSTLLLSHIHVKCVLWHFIVITLFNPKYCDFLSYKIVTLCDMSSFLNTYSFSIKFLYYFISFSWIYCG